MVSSLSTVLCPKNEPVSQILNPPPFFFGHSVKRFACRTPIFTRLYFPAYTPLTGKLQCLFFFFFFLRVPLFDVSLCHHPFRWSLNSIAFIHGAAKFHQFTHLPYLAGWSLHSFFSFNREGTLNLITRPEVTPFL